MQIKLSILRTSFSEHMSNFSIFCFTIVYNKTHFCLKFFVFVRVSRLFSCVCTCLNYYNYFDFRVCIDIYETRNMIHET